MPECAIIHVVINTDLLFSADVDLISNETDQHNMCPPQAAPISAKRSRCALCNITLENLRLLHGKMAYLATACPSYLGLLHAISGHCEGMPTAGTSTLSQASTRCPKIFPEQCVDSAVQNNSPILTRNSDFGLFKRVGLWVLLKHTRGIHHCGLQRVPSYLGQDRFKNPGKHVIHVVVTHLLKRA
jgi:hypothetical protein